MACTGPVVLYMYNILDLVLALAATVATTISYSVATGSTTELYS